MKTIIAPKHLFTLLALVINSNTGWGQTTAFPDKLIKNNTVFRPVAAGDGIVYENLRVNLYLDDPDTAILADGVYVQYNDNFLPGVDELDAFKFTNILENFGLLRDGNTLMLERRPLIKETDTLFFKLWRTTERNYQFRFSSKGLNHPSLEGFLEDSYLKTSTPVDLNGYTNISFSITGDTLSQAVDRFMVVCKSPAASRLPLTFTSIKAYRQFTSINVEWNVDNAVTMRQFEVERSTDGRRFIKESVVPVIAKNSSGMNYLWHDEHIAAGTVYYRIYSISNSGKAKYSDVVKVTIDKAIPRLYAYPNPVVASDNINIYFINQQKGKYDIKLLNNLGQLIAIKKAEITNDNQSEKLPISKTLSYGTYHLEITRPGGHKTNLPLLY